MLDPEERTALVLSIEHWKRMVEWAKKQPKYNLPTRADMNRDIEEDWYGNNCALCRRHIADECAKCCLSLSPKTTCTSYNSLWVRVELSRSWLQWVENAEIFISAMEGILNESDA